MKILNLYAGIGGNRGYWPSSDEITAVELDGTRAEIYEKLYPGDNVVIADSRTYLLQNYEKYEFIWASPPCNSHSRFRLTKEPEYVDLGLYELIIFLQTWFKGLWCVENVESYYPGLVPAIKRGRHRLWTNFYVPEFNVPSIDISAASMEMLRAHHGYANISLKASRSDLRNMCHPKIGKEVYEAALLANKNANPLDYHLQSDWMRRDKRDDASMRD